MIKFITTFTAALLIVSFLDNYAGAEPDLSGLYASTPYDRCMEAYENTSAAAQCALLK